MIFENYRHWTLLLLLGWLALGGCKVGFNFTGGVADTSLETLNVEQFSNEAPIVVPSLAQIFTEALQNRFIAQSKLKLTDGAADVRLSGAIVQYTIAPIAIQGNNQAGNPSAAQNRLTIVVRVNFENNVNKAESWEQNFTGYEDFDATSNFSQIEEALIDEILLQLNQDIFSKSIGKW